VRRLLPLLLLLIAGLSPVTVAGKSMTDAQVRDAMIAQSISAYPGNCPCPYNRASNGSRCGKRSAWSKPGGYSPLCFREDISDDMVKQYRKAHGISAPGQ
jgi:hypothetical protein